MTIYEFQDVDGNLYEIPMPMAEVPRIGEPIALPNGVMVKRPVPGKAFNASRPRAGDHHRFKARSVRRWHPDAPRYDRRGVACFQSRYELEEWLKKNPDYVQDASCGDESHHQASIAAQKERQEKAIARLSEKQGSEMIRRAKHKFDSLRLSGRNPSKV